MMMTQSYYGGGGDFDNFARPGTRGLSNASAYYERAAPYDYYHEPRHGLRGEYGGRHQAHTLIQEQESMESVGGQSRRRIAVACGRCRRRKIKCSGDPGDGTGCQACRQAGANINDCTFIRVGSHVVASPSMSMLPPVSSSSAPQPLNYNLEHSPPHSTYAPSGYHSLHRASLPTLHTRGYAPDYEAPFETSPTDAYTYALPRQDSFASTYSADRTTASAPSPFYDTPSYSLGALHSPLPPRLPSVTADSMSALNMGSLHSSLPAHPATERRLPVPYTIQYPPPSYPTSTQLPALDAATAGFRSHVHRVHNRNAMPWSSDGGSRSGSLALHQTSNAANVNTPVQASASYDPGMGHGTSRTQLLTEPCTPSSSASDNPNGNNNLGYIFPPYTSETSPTSAAPQSHGEVYTPVTGTASLMMPPTTGGLRYRGSASSLPGSTDDSSAATSSGVGGNQGAAAHTPRTSRGNGNGNGTNARHREAAASLFSFSTETSDHANVTTSSDLSATLPTSRSDVGESGWSGRPQHAPSSQGLRRLSGHEGGRGGSGGGDGRVEENGLGSMTVGHRTSARSLNGRH